MPLLGNGKSDDQVRQEQRDAQLHQMNLSAADAEQPMDRAYIEKMTEGSLQDPTKDMLQNLLSQDFLLGNLQEAETHEYRWLARVMLLEIKSLHPSGDSIWQDEIRAAAFDDKNQQLESLSQREQAIVEQFVMGVIARASRGRDGWQQEMFNKTISASEKRDVSDSDDGGFL